MKKLNMDMIAKRLGAERLGKVSFPKEFERLKGTAKNEKCSKTDEQGMCCCTCAFHYKDFSHPLTDGGVISHVRGWICGCPELGHFSEWGKHGLCECWQKGKKGVRR